MMRRVGCAICLLAHVAALNAMQPQVLQPSSPAVDTPAAIAPDDKLNAQLRAIDAQTQAIHDLTADFEQDKYTSLLKKPLASKGTLHIKGSAMRWDADKPQPSTIAIDESSLKMYYPRQATLEIYPIERQMSQLAASPLFRAEALRKHFTIERGEWTEKTVSVPDDHLTIRLVPNEPELREHVEAVIILFDLKTGYVNAAEVQYPDSDRLVIRFTNVRTNTGLRDDDIALAVPDGTIITHPLDFRASGAQSDEPQHAAEPREEDER